MNKVFILAIATMLTLTADAQKYFTRTGFVSFFSDTKMEDIKAENNKVASVLDVATGDIEFTVLVKSFVFEKALMQEHFNENYMESDTYPKSTFKGKVENMSSVKVGSNGTYNAKVTGDLTMHGVTKKVTSDATFTVKDGKLSAASTFYVNPKDYNIAIPSVVQDNISDNIEVKVQLNLDEMKK